MVCYTVLFKIKGKIDIILICGGQTRELSLNIVNTLVML